MPYATCRLQDAAKKLSVAKAELDQHRQRLAEAEQGITQVMGELERLNAKHGHLKCAGAA
jgi:chromosome segregation ATPase